MTILDNEAISKHSKIKQSKKSLKRKQTRDSDIETPCKKSNTVVDIESNMLNGLRSEQKHEHVTNIQEAPVASLLNMGNTCYLNSVLYTLRFAPGFLHNLHHLICDLSLVNTRLSQNRAKTSSLGRNITAISGPNPHTSKDEVLSKSKVQIVTESLHELFVTMHNLELKDSSGSCQPNALLHAIREANSIFEGNHQQDAHELLLYLLDNIRETGDFLTNQLERNPNLLNEPEYPTSSNSGKMWGIPRSWKRNPVSGRKGKTTKDAQNGDCPISEFDDLEVAGTNSETNQRKIGYNFLSEDFEGSTLVRTKCLECESVTEKKELFYDIPVPIINIEADNEKNPSDIYREACVTYEKLFDSNKYFCEECGRYNEAIREILFERLPNMMILQLKRFNSSTSGVHKVNTYLPTPLVLDCFCETCCISEESLHFYKLCCIIMHLGGTMASGHYISYVKVSNYFNSYHDCSRDLPKSNLSASCSEKSLNFLKFLKNRTTMNSFIDAKNGISSKSINGLKICKSIDCCSVGVNKNVLENALNSQIKRNDYEEDLWLECDDDSIRFLKSEELTNILSKKPDSTATPYLLFYTKTNRNFESDSN